MTKMKFLITIITGFILATGCKKGIETDPVSIITPGTFFKTQDDVAGALRGMYYQLRIPASSDLYFMGEGRSDVLRGAAAGTLGFDRYYNNTLNVTNPGPNWMSLYTVINTANLILKYAPDISFASESVKKSSLAQAYTMRAFVYFSLVRTWGGVPIRTEPTEKYDPATIQVARSGAEDVFKLIKQDLDQALSLYPDNAFGSNRSYWNKPAANALKGEVYLWTGKRMNGGAADFTTALTALNDAKGADLQLLPNYADIFSYTNKNNAEILMSVRFQLLDQAPNNYYTNMYIINLSGLPAPIQSVVGVQGGNGSVMQIADTVRRMFTSDDQRRAATFYEVFDKDNKYYAAITMKGRGVVDGGARSFFTDVILYRLADVLLLIAEAKNALGQDPAAEINSVRQRAYGTSYPSHIFVNGSKESNDAAILKERLLELCTEGKRWWDLVRFDQAFKMVPSLKGKEAGQYLLLFPIGQTIRSLEPLVTENPGWE
ncbi:RagB/SusD family nutrient uptake outer membrane protein [Niabella pedocola]|uniref:RagB/SusD family nutrient uptake outer membrane protein n=1 Tax=Niabella pedocola TaxID=1752077 RepID=A0ABS8PNF8_9BACT|nr:RagB/SusD family nutrient uptake outer membrane protein [Niabella pedocola]MCD2422654.1 RagB/SusD family nutrient uptake outer membrane protein [Niabella pedocola]